MKDLCRDIYDLYAEDEEEEEDRLSAPPSHLLFSPAKHLTLNINVGGTVSSLPLYQNLLLNQICWDPAWFLGLKALVL